jgi:MoxR-like ATPase
VNRQFQESVQAATTVESAFDIVAALQREIGKVVVGQHVLITRLLTGLFAAIPYATVRTGSGTGCGHVLLEGVPGVAKTLVATTIAQAISADFQRVQLTPDLMPADIVGTRIYEAATATFRVEKGPIFTNILLADEINRCTPKTQSALLEAMQERQVTLADETFPLADPFWVLATENPVEQEGVYTLPEAQLDRFSMLLRVGYPAADEESQMLRRRLVRARVEPCVSPREVVQLRDFIRDTVHVDDRIGDYIVRIGRATRAPAEVGRPHLKEMILLGISPRSYQHMLALAQVTAFLHGRTYVLPDDVKEIMCDATRHRIIRTVRAQAENVDVDEILLELARTVPI